MRREEWVTVQGPIKEQQPDGMSHRGGGGVLGWWVFSRVGGSKALDPPPLIIPRLFWVGLLPPLLSLLTGALSGCLLVPLSALSLCRYNAKSLCGFGVFVGFRGSREQTGSKSQNPKREHLKSEKHKQWVKAKKSQRPLNCVSPLGAGMPTLGERLGFNLTYKNCSPQNYKRGLGE